MNASGTSPVQRRSLRATVAGVAAIAVVLLGGSSATAASVPNSMASVGDSITRAYNTGSAFADNPAGSWSTGTSSTVVSHYTRLLALNPAISGHAFNDAKSGALMVDLAGQLATAASQHVDYVTILMGGNDVCQPSEAAMTPVATFEGQFSSALASFTAASPATSVYVVSLPNVRNLWSALKGNALARFVWALGSVCPSMLARPLSTAQSDEDRRARVLQREIDYNAALARICAQYVQCRFDGNAVFGITFTASDVSTRDYFHPSLAGQKKLAAVSWTAGSWGP